MEKNNQDMPLTVKMVEETEEMSYTAMEYMANLPIEQRKNMDTETMQKLTWKLYDNYQNPNILNMTMEEVLNL